MISERNKPGLWFSQDCILAKSKESRFFSHGHKDSQPRTVGLLSRLVCSLFGYLGKFFSVSCFVLFVGGCGVVSVVESELELPILQRLRPLPVEPACRVAVLPFVNESDYPSAEIISYKVFSSVFSEMNNSWLAQEGDIRKIYQQLRVFPGQTLNQEQLELLANRSNVQLLIVGTVIEMEENQGRNDTVNPVLTLRIKIIDSLSSETLWETYHHRQGVDYRKVLHFGQINSIAGLCQQVSKEIISQWLEKGFPLCNVFP